jgi:DNA-binding NarL/FixJ family response regulator
LKKVVISICNSLRALSIRHTLEQTGDFRVYSVDPGGGTVVQTCIEASAEVLLLETAYQQGSTIHDRLAEAKALRKALPHCKVVLLCDENSVPGIARSVAVAKKDGLIDDFVYSSVSASYFVALLDAT